MDLSNYASILEHAGDIHTNNNTDLNSADVNTITVPSACPPKTVNGTDRVTLNIGGRHFKTYWSTLQSIPDTRLSDLNSQDPAYDKHSNEFFFDRNSRLFVYILDLYRQGDLHFPHCICAPMVKRELAYWRIPDKKMSLCCVKKYAEYEESTRTLVEIGAAFAGEEVGPEGTTRPDASWGDRLKAWKIQTWVFLEDANSSRPAKVWAYLFVLLLLSSILIVCLDSVPSFRSPRTKHHADQVDPRYNVTHPLVFNNPKLTMYLTTAQHPAMFYTNHFCSIFFGIELLVRFCACPAKRYFLLSFFNIIDVLAVVPTLAASIVSLIDLNLWLLRSMTLNYFIFTFTSIFRAIRIVKLMKHCRGLRIMCLALKASAPEMLLLTLLLTIGVLIFSTTVYFAELRNPDTFPSIPVGFWWSVVTMTTVGYGDVTPMTPGGSAVGALCAVCGMLITGLPIPVMANNFNLYYTYAKLHKKLEERKGKMALLGAARSDAPPVRIPPQGILEIEL